MVNMCWIVEERMNECYGMYGYTKIVVFSVKTRQFVPLDKS